MRAGGQPHFAEENICPINLFLGAHSHKHSNQGKQETNPLELRYGRDYPEEPGYLPGGFHTGVFVLQLEILPYC